MSNEKGTDALLDMETRVPLSPSVKSPTAGKYGAVPTSEERFLEVESPLQIAKPGFWSRKLIFTVIGVAACVALIAGILAGVLSGSDSSGTDDGCSYTDYRLRDTTTPTAYSVHWTPLFVEPFTFTGTTVIEAFVTASGQRCIQLHAKDLSFDSVQVAFAKQAATAQFEPVQWFYNPDATTERIILQLPRVANPGDNVVIKFAFHADLNTDMVGLYLSTYTDDAGKPVNTICTQFEATAARRAFPCFDEPAYKAIFNITLDGVPTGHTALSNMPVVSQTARDNGTWTYVYQSSPKMSTYLVAAVAAPLISVTGTSGANNVTVSVYAVANANNDNLISYALHAGMAVLNYYESVFKVPYPLPKLDMVAIPDFAAGAMENWGLITYRETALLGNISVSSASELQRIVVVVAHEIAHQWFGNLVTMEWWDSLFLNEGDASLWEYLGTQAVHPEFEIIRQFVVTDVKDAMESTWFGQSRQLVNSVASSGEIEAQFDGVSYSFGASILYMLKNFLDMYHPGTYFAGMQQYLRDNAYGNAEPSIFWGSLAASSGMTDLPRYMSMYTSQTGYPMVSLAWINQDGKTTGVGGLAVSQQRHFLSPFSRSRAPGDQLDNIWWIPITLYGEHPAAGSGVITAQVAAGQQGGFTSATWQTTIGAPGTPSVYDLSRDGYIKVNVNATGYYRVNYPLNVWQALGNSTLQLVKSGLAPSLSPADRGNLLDDLFTFAYGQVAQADGINMAFYLDFARFLEYDTSYEAWVPGASSYAHLRQLLINDNGVPSNCYQNAMRYVQKMVTPLFNTLGFNGDQAPLSVQLRSSAISVGSAFNQSAIVQGAFDLYSQLGPANIPANIQSPVLASVIRWAPDRTAYDAVRQLYIASNDASIKRRYVGALAATQNVSLLSSLLVDALDTSIVRKQDTVSVVLAVSANPFGRGLAWDFVRNNWNVFVARYGDGGFAFSDLLYGIAANFQSQPRYDEVQAFFNSHPSSAAALNVQQALEMVGTNIGWVSSDLAATCTYLNAFSV